MDWSQINWQKVYKLIRNLQQRIFQQRIFQQRIFRARKLGQWKQLRILPSLVRSCKNLSFSSPEFQFILDLILQYKVYPKRG